MATGPLPDQTDISLHALKTADGQTVQGILFAVPGATRVATLMHPRSDVTRHYLVPLLLEAGIAVWTQSTRSPGSDLMLIHEEAVTDFAAGMAFLADHGFEEIVTLGVSGGGPLLALYLQQAARSASARLSHTPGGKPTVLPDLTMPLPNRTVFLAAHPGPGLILQRCIDPAVASETDPSVTVTSLDLYDPANGFEPSTPVRYPEEFLIGYRQAQWQRVARIDAYARALVERRQSAKSRGATSHNLADVRAGLVTGVLTIHRTDADPRCVDLSLDPSDRPYGSVWGRRPDITNFGLTGFGRLATAEAWLSTWSANSSRARFVDCAAEITTPTLFIEFTGDQIAMPADSAAMFASIASDRKDHQRIRGTHFGGAVAGQESMGGALAAEVIVDWMLSVD
jgi:hypothetical protein